MDDFIAPGWQTALEARGLATFDALWALDAEWFEPPNKRRGGWSGVVRIEVDGPDGGRVGLFLKRQQNHLRRTFKHPLGGEPTFAAEMRNILALHALGVPTLTPVFYAQRKIAGKWCVVLMTVELASYRPLDDWTAEWAEAGWRASRSRRLALIDEMAPHIRAMHLGGYVHNALHPKHVFVRFDAEGRPQSCLIDLEKMRREYPVLRNTIRDLDSFNRRNLHFSTADRLRFLQRYLGDGELSWRGWVIWQWLRKRYARAMRRRNA